MWLSISTLISMWSKCLFAHSSVNCSWCNYSSVNCPGLFAATIAADARSTPAPPRCQTKTEPQRLRVTLLGLWRGEKLRHSQVRHYTNPEHVCRLPVQEWGHIHKVRHSQLQTHISTQEQQDLDTRQPQKSQTTGYFDNLNRARASVSCARISSALCMLDKVPLFLSEWQSTFQTINQTGWTQFSSSSFFFFFFKSMLCIKESQKSSPSI